MSFRDRAEARWAARGKQSGGPVRRGEPITVTYEVFIERSAQAIWDAMADVTAVLLPSDAIKRVERVVGTGPGVGRQVTYLYEREGQQPVLQVETVLSESAPAYLETSRSVSADSVSRTQRWIEHTGSGCRVRWQSDYPAPGGLTDEQRERFADGVRGVLEAHVQRWKRLLETGSLDS